MRAYLKKKHEGNQLLLFAIEICELCIELGITFVFEHPYSASSWKHRAMERLLRNPKTFFTKADQCCYGLTGDSGKLQRKATGFLTNNEHLSSALQRQCDRGHEHEVIIGGNRSRKSQQYPEELKEVILKTYGETIHDKVEIYSVNEIYEEDERINEALRLEAEVLHQEDDWEEICKKFGEDPDEELQQPGAHRDIDHPDYPESGPPTECPGDQERGHDQVCPGPQVSGSPKEPGDPGIYDGHPGAVLPVPEKGDWKELPLASRFTLSRLLQRAHEGLGHPSNERFLRILRYAKAKPEVIEAAKKMKCSVCERHKQVRPARRGAPPKELHFNECVGVDVVYLPTLGGKTRPSLNIIDWSSKFQLVIPLLGKKPEHVREGYRHWLRIFGAPKRVAIDLGKEFRAEFAVQAEADGSYIDPAAVEMPQQRGITERHGKTFKFILLKSMDTYSCANMKEWEELVSIACMMKNRMMSVSGYSPCQRVLGYNPNIPGGLLSGGHDVLSENPNPKIGDLSIERSMKMRKAAATAFVEADASDALRRAISSGPRPITEFEIGEMVYFYRMGADKKLKFNPGYWQGPARVVMIDQPSTLWLAHRDYLIKASPERVRRASAEEQMTISGWLEDIVQTKKDFATEPKRGYLDLSEHPLPPGEQPDDEDVRSEGYEPSIAEEDKEETRESRERPEMEHDMPIKRHRTKGPQEYGPVIPSAVLPVPQDPHQEAHVPAPLPEIDEEEKHDESHKREHDTMEDGDDEPSAKRTRTEYLEIYFTKVENLLKSKQKKEIKYQALDEKSKKRFDQAIIKEFKNNTDIGAYKVLSVEESAKIRQTMPEKIMESRLVLTAKPLEPHEVGPAQQEGLLLDRQPHDPDGEPCKAKARHVMKGYSEEGADEIEAATPQVTREGTLTVAQLIASFCWRLGFLDFTQAFHSGDQIQRLLFATQPREGIPGLSPAQLLKLEKVCYGLTDGPLAWFLHLNKFLTKKLGYAQSLADPCIYYKINNQGRLSGLIAVATDDLLHGGDEEHLQAMEEIRKHYKLGKYQFDKGKFTGKYFEQKEDFSIEVSQAHYVNEKLFDINIPKSRKRQRFSFCTEAEISQLRASIGALSWLSKESRPDLAGRVALLQQAFPQPRVRDLIEANAITAEAKKYPDSGIKIMPIKPENLRIGVATDASWANSKDKNKLEENSKDFWEEKPTYWIRHHELAAAVAKMDAVHVRVSEERVAREAHVASLESLKKAHGSLASEKQALEKHHATLEERLDYLEKALGDSSDKHTRELEALKAAHQKVATEHKSKEQSHGQVADRLTQLQREKEDLHARHMLLGERVDYLEKLLGESAEKHTQEIEKFKAKHAKDLDASASKMQSHHAGLQERLEYLESKICDSADKHAKELSNMHAKMQELHGKLQDEKNHREEKLLHITGHFRDQISGEQKTREERHASIEERVKFLESAIGNNAATVDELKQKYEKQGTALEDLRSSHVNLSTGKSSLDSHHATLKERMDSLESMMGDSADNYNKVLQVHKADHAKLSNELHAHQANHATLADRMGYMEQLMGDSFEKHAKELAAAMAKMDAMHGKVSEERVASEELAAAKAMEAMRGQVSEERVAPREAHMASLESLKKAHGSVASQKQALETHHATLQERIDYLEKALGDSSDKHARELEALKAAHQKVLVEHKGKEQSLFQMQREKDELHARHMSLGERVDYLEKLLGESAEKHQQELEKFKGKHAKLDAGANKLQSHHDGLQERLEYLETKIGDSADQHAKELSNIQAKMQDLHSKLQDEKNREEEKLLHLTGYLREQVSAHKAREERHASMEERVKFLESLIRDTADKHKKGLEEHSKGVKALSEKHDRLEKMLGASAEKHAQEEAARLQVEELLRRETQERHKHHETQSELVDSLQRTVGIFDVLIRKDMEERKLEMKHIWEAIDGHTHDLSSKVKAIGSDTEDLEDETRLRPCVVARSSPSLPGVVSPSVRSGAGGANSPKVVTYRPAAVLPASQARIVYPSTVMQAPAPAPIALQSSTRSGLIAAPGRSLSPSRRIDHSEVVCGKARYQGERAHNAEIFRCHD
eukprot:s2194_g11.t1